MKKRRMWVAGCMSLVCPGLGYLYVGRIYRAAMVISTLLIISCAIPAIFKAYSLKPYNIFLPFIVALIIYVFSIINSVLIAKKQVNYSYKKYNKWYYYVLFFSIFIATDYSSSYISPYEILNMPSMSMQNTIMVNDEILAEYFYNDDILIERDMLIIFIYPRDGVTKYLKRCVGLPGDTILIKDKILYVNNVQEKRKPTIINIDTLKNGEQNIHSRKEGNRDSRDQFGPFVVPEDNYFMLGDNRDNSYDSRYWGTVPDSLLIGKVYMIIWSSDYSRIGMKLE